MARCRAAAARGDGSRGYGDGVVSRCYTRVSELPETMDGEEFQDDSSSTSKTGSKDSTVPDNDVSSFASDLLKNTTDYQTQFSLFKMHKVISMLTDNQKDIVKEIGLGSLLRLKCTRYNKGIVFWLAKNYDPNTRLFKIRDGVSFPLNSITTHLILGILYNGLDIPQARDSLAAGIISANTGQGSSGAKIEDLIALITPSLDGDKFAMIFMLIALSVFLCPTCNIRISSKFYRALSVVENIKSYNWSATVSDWLHSRIVTFQSNLRKGNVSGKAGLGGCLFIIVVAFFEYLLVPDIHLEESLPQLKIWDDELIEKFGFAEFNMKNSMVKITHGTRYTKKYSLEANCSSSYDAASVQKIVGGSSPLVKRSTQMLTNTSGLEFLPTTASILGKKWQPSARRFTRVQFRNI